MRLSALLSLCLLIPAAAFCADQWPDLSSPAPDVGGGERDGAVIVGIENYFAVPGIPGAESNAKAWYDYFTKTRGTPAAHVRLLLNNDAAREDILGAAQKAAAKVGADGTLWFVFIGHGAPAADGKDGLLIGVDAQQKAESLQTHSVRRGELMKALAAGRAGKIMVVLDACFSGRGADGASIAPGLQPLVTIAAADAVDPRMAVLTAAKGDQFAGSLPGAERPAFSYLVLGALRGWAGRAEVTAADLLRYSTDALEATLRGRNQTPDLLGNEGAIAAASAGERGPDLTALAKATAGGEVISRAKLPPVSVASTASESADTVEFKNVDIESLNRYDAAVKLDKEPNVSAEQKAASWRRLAKDSPRFADLAQTRAAEWERLSAQKRARADASTSDAEHLAYPDLDLDALREQISDYRHRAELLRKSVGVRERGLSQAQSRAAQIVQAAEEEAERQRQAAVSAQQQAGANQAGAQAAGAILGALFGNSMLSNAVQTGIKGAAAANAAGANAAAVGAESEGAAGIARAERAAAPLREQAKAFEGEKKRLALKADQYEELADAKDLLIAAETLRKQAKETAKASEQADKSISDAKAFVDRLDIW